MNHQEIASLLGVHEKTIQRYWQVAKVWLYPEVFGMMAAENAVKS